MKLASMKLDPEQQKKEADSMVTDKPVYPWGLCVELNEDALQKLGMKDLPDVDDSMTLTARVVVTSVSSNATTDGENRRVSLQITDMELGPEQKDSDADDSAANASSKLYSS